MKRGGGVGVTLFLGPSVTVGTPLPVPPLPPGPQGVAVTVMVTFTGASMDSCAGSEAGVAGGVSVPEEQNEQAERCLGGGG